MPVTSDSHNPTHFPLERLIRASLLHTLTVLVVVGGTAAGLLYLNQLPIVAEQSWGENVARLFVFPGGTIGILFQSFLLFASSVLCFMIGWARSRSQSDYSGEYRVWKWAWKFWAVAAICVATNAHIAFADVFARFARPTWNHGELLNWAFPVALIGLPIHLRCWRDMSRCLTSTLLLVGALSVYSAVAFSPLFAAWKFLPQYVPVINLVVCCVVFTAFFLHTRFVLHVNYDPPESPLRNDFDPSEFAQTQKKAQPGDVVEDEFAGLDNELPAANAFTGITGDDTDESTATPEAPFEHFEDELPVNDADGEFAILNEQQPADIVDEFSELEGASSSAETESQRVLRLENPEDEIADPAPAITRRRKRKSGRR